MATIRLAARAPTRPDIKRRKIREEHWKGAGKFIWDRSEEKGFVTVPRTLPLIVALIKHLSLKNDASRVYLDLWGRSYDQGVVEVNDEKQFAMSSGYADNSRNVRSWQERMNELEAIGFILTAPSASRKFGFVLLLHPHVVVEAMHQSGSHRIPDWWWGLYRERMRDIGAKLPNTKDFDAFLTRIKAPRAPR